VRNAERHLGLNLYAYVDNDPAGRIDPLGTGPAGKHLGIAAWLSWWSHHSWSGHKWIRIWWLYPNPPRANYYYPSIPPRLVGSVGGGGGGGGGGAGAGDCGGNGDGNWNGNYIPFDGYWGGYVGANWVPVGP